MVSRTAARTMENEMRANPAQTVAVLRQAPGAVIAVLSYNLPFAAMVFR